MEDPRIDKLPVWAQELIDELTRQRIEAVEALHKFEDNQTKSDMWIDELLRIASPPKFVKTYIQSRRIAIHAGGRTFNISIRSDRNEVGCLDVSSEHGCLSVEPVSGNRIYIRGKD